MLAWNAADLGRGHRCGPGCLQTPPTWRSVGSLTLLGGLIKLNRDLLCLSVTELVPLFFIAMPSQTAHARLPDMPLTQKLRGDEGLKHVKVTAAISCLHHPFSPSSPVRAPSLRHQHMALSLAICCLGVSLKMVPGHGICVNYPFFI